MLPSNRSQPLATTLMQVLLPTKSEVSRIVRSGLDATMRLTQISGPCPGLNAASNHGYLSRSGVTTVEETITGLGSAYAMGADFAGLLAVYAVLGVGVS